MSYLTVSEVAAHFGVTERAIANWIEAGHLPGSRKKGPFRNSAWEIPEAAVEQLDRKREITQPKAK